MIRLVDLPIELPPPTVVSDRVVDLIAVLMLAAIDRQDAEAGVGWIRSGGDDKIPR